MKRILSIALVAVSLRAETKTVVKVDTAAIVDSLIRLWLQRHREHVQLCDPLFDSGCPMPDAKPPQPPPANQTGTTYLPDQCPGIAPCKAQK